MGKQVPQIILAKRHARHFTQHTFLSEILTAESIAQSLTYVTEDCPMEKFKVPIVVYTN